VAYEEQEDAAFLLMTAVPGRDCTDTAHAADIPAMVRGLADGLRLLHATPPDGCPFDHTPAADLARVRLRVERNLVDAREFGAPAEGRTPAEALAELLAMPLPDEEPVLTHGDYCLPNVLLDGGRLAGFCDLGRLGVGGRYRDLALAARSLAYNWGAAHVPLLFESYGIGAPDQRKLDFYLLLDELF
jgi:aminoglycoside phosphotransferase